MNGELIPINPIREVVQDDEVGVVPLKLYLVNKQLEQYEAYFNLMGKSMRLLFWGNTSAPSELELDGKTYRARAIDRTGGVLSQKALLAAEVDEVMYMFVLDESCSVVVKQTNNCWIAAKMAYVEQYPLPFTALQPEES